jgi:hypothetical protein
MSTIPAAILVSLNFPVRARSHFCISLSRVIQLIATRCPQAMSGCTRSNTTATARKCTSTRAGSREHVFETYEENGVLKERRVNLPAELQDEVFWARSTDLSDRQASAAVIPFKR